MLADLDLFIQVQVEHDQLLPLAPLLEQSGARILIDHCGRPTPAAGLEQPGFRALVALARTGRAAVKLSGYQKFSAETAPYRDALPFVHALIDAFTLDACVWASDWPFLKATERLDVGPLLRGVEQLLPRPERPAKAAVGHAMPLVRLRPLNGLERCGQCMIRRAAREVANACQATNSNRVAGTACCP